jgi:regulator of protease activity HflC (stomatin/prohibitin superfamily)
LKENYGEKMNLNKTVSMIITALIALVLLTSVFSSCTTILPGFSGVLFNKLSGNMSTVGQGLAFKIPFVTSVQSYPIALRTYTMVKKAGEGSDNEDDSIDLPTKEGQHIKQDISITYNTSPEKAAQVFKTFRGQSIEEIEITFIRRTAITVAQNVAGRMSLTELISQKRDDLQSNIQDALSVELSKMGFQLDKVNLGASHLPEAIEQQMQAKMAAQQQAQQAEYKLQESKLLAEAAIANARGQAESNRLLQQAMTPAILKAKAIEKWDGVLPKIVGSKSIPFIELKLDEAPTNE